MDLAGKVSKALEQSKEKSRKVIAARAGIDTTTLWRIANGKIKSLKTKTAEKLAAAVGKPSNFFSDSTVTRYTARQSDAYSTPEWSEVKEIAPYLQGKKHAGLWSSFSEARR
jgi:transcriptional regulator with XRE-family HTH domain